MPDDLDKRRSHERSKYRSLLHTSYGSTNHGRNAYPLVVNISPQNIADFGCGRNNFIRDMRKLGFKGVGIDFAFPEADIHAPMHFTTLTSQTYDLVTSFDALEHLLPEEVPEVLLEMQRVSTPNGNFIFSISTRESRIKVNGENLHPTVKPKDWWLSQISEVGQPTITNGYITGKFKTPKVEGSCP